MTAGIWSVRLAYFGSESSTWGTSALCIVGQFEDAAVWAPQSGPVPSFSLDHGVAAVYDPGERLRLSLGVLAEDNDLLALNDRALGAGVAAVVQGERVSMVMFDCLGGCSYPVWVGHDDSGVPVCAVADLGLLHEWQPVDGPPPE